MVGKCGTHKEDYKKTQRERTKLAPRSLPETRPRSLTAPLDLEKAAPLSLFSRVCKSKQQQTSSQLQSPLFRLSPELRRKIWRLVIGGHWLHIIRAPHRLLGVACSDEHGQLLRSRHHLCWGDDYRYYTHGAPFCRYLWEDHPSQPARLLRLPLTCRLVYSETIPIMYSDNVFDLNHIDTVAYLSRCIMPSRRRAIRHLELTWDFLRPGAPPPYDLSTWDTTCQTLATFNGLQTLTVRIGLRGARSDASWLWHDAASSLSRIKAPPHFEVIISSMGGELVSPAKNSAYHFQVQGEEIDQTDINWVAPVPMPQSMYSID